MSATKITRLFVVAVLVLTAAAGAVVAAETQTWTGWVTDSHCGAGGANAKHTKACVEKCAQSGKVQFFDATSKTLYDIDKVDEALELVGQQVKITGVLEGSAIKVASIAKAG